MHIALTHGYFLAEDPKEKEIMRPYVPLGLLYISAYLEKQHVTHTVYDTTFSTFDDLTAYLLTERPQLLGLYVNLMTRKNILRVIRFIRETDALRNMHIVLGGPEVRNHAGHFLEFGADYLVLGEGEQTFYELAMYLAAEQKGAPLHIHGLAFRGMDKEVVFTSEREKLKDLDTLPFPNRKKVDLHAYLQAWKNKHGRNAISVSTMRGCPYTCKWCSRAVYGLSYRRRSPEQVVQELMEIQKEYAPDTIWFVDDVFTISHVWLKGFHDAIKANNLQIAYECITRADRMNAEVIQLLRDSGCFRVWIGAESGSQKIIDAMDRRVDVQQVRDMIRMTRAHGMEAGTFIMLGYPGETEADIEETIRHLKASEPDHFTITLAYPIKGTELYTETESVFTSVPDWATGSDREIDFKRNYSKRFYHYAVRRVVNEVQYHKTKKTGFKIKSIGAKTGMFLSKW
ncbi:MAG: radical SAM protein [Chitinophagales bacterium]